MAEQKKFNTKHKIHIKLCLTLAKHGFKFLGTEDLLLVAGFCQECGHPIRYEQHFMDVQDGNEYILGSDCMFKIYILSHWESQIKEKDLENKHLQRAGKWLWIIHRDGYLSRIEGELPQPKDYDEDFKKLADDLKVLVLKVRAEIKKEIEKEKRIQKELDRNNREQSWLDSHGINISICNDWERNFLDTMYKAYNKRWVLSDKQQSIFDRIKTEKSNKQDVETNQNLGSVAIVDEVSKYSDITPLTDWEKDFMESIQEQVESGRSLSQKQVDILNKIKRKLSLGSEPEDNNIYIGRKIKSWIIADVTGQWVSGIVKSVKRETELAILCEVSVGNELIIDEVWIPKSALLEEVSL